MSHNQALVLARSGQMRNARIRWQHLIERAQQAGDREKAARLYRAAEAVCEAPSRKSRPGERGRPRGARNWERVAMWNTPRPLRWRSPATVPHRKRSPKIWRKVIPGRARLCWSSIFPPCARFFALCVQEAKRGRTIERACKLRSPTTSRCRAPVLRPNSEGSIPRMCAARRICRPGAAGRRRQAKRYWIIGRIVLADPIGALAYLQLGGRWSCWARKGQGQESLR